MWTIAILCLLSSFISPFSRSLTMQIGVWSPLLVQALAVVAVSRFLARADAGPRRGAWQIVLTGVCLDLLANIAWNLAGSSLQLPDEIAYAFAFAYYALAIGAAVMFYRDLGGSFRSWTVWVDLGTLLLGIGATLWLFYLRPHLADVAASGVTWLVLLGYAAGNALLMAMVALLTMQVADWRAERPLALLMAAVTVAFVGMLGWVGAADREAYTSGPLFHAIGIAIPYAMLGLAVQYERRRMPAGIASQPGGSRLNFLPVLSVLIAIALLFGEKADFNPLQRAAVLAFVLAVALLIALRQQGVRYEIGGLQRALAIKEAEARLSELVRQSSDLIALVLPGMRLSYVSPAAVDVLGVEPEELKAQPATRLLGPDNEPRMTQFLRDIGAHRHPDAGMEVSLVDREGRQRVVRVNGRRQGSESAAGAISLTVQDVTEDLRLEREILDIAARERARLSSEIHDGLGQELTGIALLLKSVDAAEHRGLAESLQQIEAHVDDVLRLTQTLASGLSLAPPGQGSLAAMLHEMAERSRQRFRFSVECRVQAGVCGLGAADTEHLYRIAQESVNNAARHSGCRHVLVKLWSEAGRLHLSVADDGCGMGGSAAAGGLGLRMIDYRVRALGGVLRLGRPPAGGTEVHVMVPVTQERR